MKSEQYKLIQAIKVSKEKGGGNNSENGENFFFF